MLNNTKQMFVRRSEAGTANVSGQSLLEPFPDCSCRHVQSNSNLFAPTPPTPPQTLPACVEKNISVWLNSQVFSAVAAFLSLC